MADTGNALVCWKCGASIAELHLPLGRLAECPACRAYLHVCRMCRFYDPRVSRQCREDDAEEVKDKEHSNFCDYFKPRPDACRSRPDARSEAARDRLDALFGGSNSEEPAGAAKQKLDQLFGPGGKREK